MGRCRSFAFTAAAAAAATAGSSWSFTSPQLPNAAAPHQAQQQQLRQQLRSSWQLVDEEGVAGEAVGEQHWAEQMCKWLGGGLAAGMVAAMTLTSSAPAEAYTSGKDAWNPARNIDWSTIQTSKRKNLQLCVDNKKFHKRIKDEIYKVTKRQKKYPKDSVVWNRFQKQIALVKRREEAYGPRYCGKKDGLPRVLINPDVRLGGVLVPGLIFLYIAGWIGWAGRSYLIRTKSAEKEINIDVPLAATCMASGFAWPVAAWQDIVNGEMVVPDSELRRSYF